MDELELRRQLRGLAREREPGRDLWAGIATRLPARRSPPRWPWAGLALAASVALLALLFRPQADIAQLASPGLSRMADAVHLEYRAAQAQLAGPVLSAELRQADRALQESEHALRAALRADPQATYLLSQLRRTAEQRLRIRQLGVIG